jgi:hypothetical protein
MLIAGAALGILSILGFRHSRKAAGTYTEHRANTPEYASATR